MDKYNIKGNIITPFALGSYTSYKLYPNNLIYIDGRYEEVYYDNKERVPFWECRNWIHPGWCGWQQVNVCDPTSEERLEYDLYYIKHRNIIWEFMIVILYITKVITGRCK